MSTIAKGDVETAFIVCVCAGLSTSVGAAIPFFRQVKASDRRILAVALSLSAGVMTLVSFGEIFFKSFIEFEIHFTDEGQDPQYAYANAQTAAWACFFSGVFLSVLLDKLVHKLDKDVEQDFDDVVKGLPQEMEQVPSTPQTPAVDEESLSCCSEPDLEDFDGHGKALEVEDSTKDKKLQKMSLIAGLALALHNFPEGLATFAATLNDPRVGGSLGVAIAIHNIPEGLVVAMPIYYATGSKWKGFMWATMSGVAEPVGAVLGYGIFVAIFDSLVYAILFGLVGGIMVYISLVELLPTAHRYDPTGKYVNFPLFVGMIIMALSLILFKY